MITEQSDRLEFMRRMCFPPFKLYLELRETLLNNIYTVKMQPMARVPTIVASSPGSFPLPHAGGNEPGDEAKEPGYEATTIAGQKTDECISLRTTSLCFSNYILDAFSWQHQSVVKRHNTNLCVALIT